MKTCLGVLAAILLSACSAMSEKVSSPSALKDRVEARWALLVQGKLAETYAYLSPATREVVSREEYAGRFKPGMWRSGTAERFDCVGEDGLCTVDVSVKYVFKPRGAAVIESVRTIKETWRKVGGEWWFVPDE